MHFKNTMNEIINAPIKLLKEMEQDSKEFKDKNKDNNSSLNTGEIPVQESPIPTNCNTAIIYNNLMSNLTRHIYRGLVDLPSYVNIKDIKHPLAVRIAHINTNNFCIRLEKRSSEHITASQFHNIIMPLLNQRMESVRFNAQQEWQTAYIDYLKDYQTLCFIFQGANEHEYYNFQSRFDSLEREYNASCSEISVFLNQISFYGYKDFDCWVDLYFTLY